MFEVSFNNGRTFVPFGATLEQLQDDLRVVLLEEQGEVLFRGAENTSFTVRVAR